MTHTKALKLALEALELHLTHHEHGCVYLDPAITAIKEALAQPVQPEVFTTGHCQEKAKPGGCQLHNIHCGFPDCDRKKS